MSDHNPNDRIYMKPNKSANEMTDEEIRAFAEEMYERIMGTLSKRKVDDEKLIIHSKSGSKKYF